MPGRPNFAYQWRSASGAQLWRLNKLGQLQFVDDGGVDPLLLTPPRLGIQARKGVRGAEDETAVSAELPCPFACHALRENIDCGGSWCLHFALWEHVFASRRAA